jgi:hypothetical protein
MPISDPSDVGSSGSITSRGILGAYATRLTSAEAFVEFNVWKYRRRDGGGLVAHQYALRDYRDPKEFLRGLRPVRQRLVRLMAEGGLVAGDGGDKR